MLISGSDCVFSIASSIFNITPMNPLHRLTSRRSLFRAGVFARLAGLVDVRASAAIALPPRGSGPEVYQRFGVEPFINCTSTYTINGGSRQLPEVIAAVEQASHYHER